MDGLELVGAQKAQVVGLDETGPLGLVPPRRLGGIAGPLGENDVVGGYRFVDQAQRVGLDSVVSGYGVGRRERRDDVGVAALQVPEVVQIAVGEDDEPAALRAGISAGLLLAHKRILIRRLGFEDDQRESLGVQQEEVYSTILRPLEVLSELI